MGDQYGLLDQGTTRVIDLEATMDSHERDGVISACERAYERRIVRMAVVVLEAACWRRREAEWNSKHMPGAVMPHYLRAGLRDVSRLLEAHGPPKPKPNAGMVVRITRKRSATQRTSQSGKRQVNRED